MNNIRKKTFFLYVFNPIEEEWDFISSCKKSEQKKLIHDSNRFADCYLWANSFLPFFTLISPIEIGPEYKEYFEGLSGTRCTILVPKKSTPFLCDDIAKDTDIFSTLVSEAKKAGSLTIYTYVMTKQVFNLKSKFENAGVIVHLPEAPQEKDLWTVAHFGSKSGFRKSFSSLMPTGSIVTDNKTVQKKAAELFETSSGIVLKTDKGNAGQGIHIYRKSAIKTKEELFSKITNAFKEESFLKKHPLVVEAYIDTSREKKSPFPSIECFIHQDGKIEIPYYCNMIVTPEGEFYGMEMHESVFTAKVKKAVLAITREIAETYMRTGYRGRFDIDMINDGEKIYANESNTRTNGGTDTYLITKKLIGPDILSKRYVLSSYIDLPKTVSRTFLTVKNICTPLLYDKTRKTGVIINSESVIINGGFSYIIVGKNKKESLTLHERLKTLLTNYKKK